MTGRLTLALALMLLVVAPASAQTRRIDSGSASFRDFSFSWETRLVPPRPPLSESFGAAYSVTTLNEVHRILLDGSRRVYFGYTVRIDLTAERAVYSLAFRPLSLTPDLRTRFDMDATWKPLPAPQLPAFQTLRGGEVLELSLLSNDASAQRLLEYVTVQEPARTGFNAPERAHRELVVAPGTPRDFTVADAVLQLREPRLYVNGRLDASSQRLLGEHTGGILWIYIPKRGRFLLSIVPHARLGFRRAGEIRGSSLQFTSGGTYTVNSAGRIAPGDAAFNLYVRHQPEWRPSYPNADLEVVTVGAADRAEDLMAR